MNPFHAVRASHPPRADIFAPYDYVNMRGFREFISSIVATPLLFKLEGTTESRARQLPSSSPKNILNRSYALLEAPEILGTRRSSGGRSKPVSRVPHV